jgi:hypothetical protein
MMYRYRELIVCFAIMMAMDAPTGRTSRSQATIAAADAFPEAVALRDALSQKVFHFFGNESWEALPVSIKNKKRGVVTLSEASHTSYHPSDFRPFLEHFADASPIVNKMTCNVLPIRHEGCVREGCKCIINMPFPKQEPPPLVLNVSESRTGRTEFARALNDHGWES